MKWKKSDLEKYVPEKEYIDTLVVPLFPIVFSNDHQLANQALQTEILSILTNELEQELAGRVLLTPSYNYLKSTNKELEISRVNDWVKDAKKQPFKHVFLITYDPSWKKNERNLDGSLLWIPSITPDDTHSEEMKKFIRNQVNQLVELIKSYW